MDLHRLVYTSYRKQQCTDEEITNILTACEKNNPEKKVTGILLHSDLRFIQYLEGDKTEVKELFDKISLDSRHDHVKIRDFSPIENKIFSSWNMGNKNVELNRLELNIKVDKGQVTQFKQVIEGDEEMKDDSIALLQIFFELA